MMNGVYFLLGSNLGERLKNLNLAACKLKEQIGNVLKTSRIYETEAWGKINQPTFLNQVILVETPLAPLQVLKTINNIEEEIGRIRYQKWAERIIDIDIIYFNNEIINTEILTIPHPEIQNRRFTLVPLVEIAPEFVHPVIQKDSIQLLTNTTDNLQVKLFNDIDHLHP